MATRQTRIIGAGMTGLAAGYASGLPVYEAVAVPGGICSSYYMRPGDTEGGYTAPADGDAYRFEIGGGHWIFGGDAALMRFLEKFGPLSRYKRRSSVYFPDTKTFIPYPLQNHLRYLDKAVASRALREISGSDDTFRTMKDWLNRCFGDTLCEMFFYPFHQLYTAGLYEKIAPQDAYKSPVDLKAVIRGASKNTAPVGYNTEFVYPASGLNELARQLADRCDLQYGKRLVALDAENKTMRFADGTTTSYDELISTLPLNQMAAMAGLDEAIEADPYSSVLVLNIGAVRGARCPDDHWLYIPQSLAGFHRVGFYSNVDPSFLPAGDRKSRNKASIYVEKAYPGGAKPTEAEIDDYQALVVQELQDWGFIEETDVVDPTWIDVAYTWAWPESKWKQWALEELAQRDIHQAGRYGRWTFNGIAASLNEGLAIGAAYR